MPIQEAEPGNAAGLAILFELSVILDSSCLKILQMTYGSHINLLDWLCLLLKGKIAEFFLYQNCRTKQKGKNP